jgi:hypothetical protein
MQMPLQVSLPVLGSVQHLWQKNSQQLCLARFLAFRAAGSMSVMLALPLLITVAACAGSVPIDMNPAPNPAHNSGTIQNLRMRSLLFPVSEPH